MALLSFLKLHWTLSGGGRANGLAAALVAGLVLVGAVIQARSASGGAVATTWFTMLNVAQAVFLLLLAPGALGKAVQLDHTTRVIESHRLLPVSNLQLALGYFMSPVLALTLYLTALVLALAFGTAYGTTLGDPFLVLGAYVFLQALLVCLALMIMSLFLLNSLCNPGKSRVLTVVFVIALFGGAGLIELVPGLALLSGLLSGSMLFDVLSKGAPPSNLPPVIVSALLQFAYSLLFIDAAARIIRRPKTPVFGGVPGLIFLALVAWTLAYGLMAPDPSFLGRFGPRGAEVVAGSIGAFLLLALIPLIAVAHRIVRAHDAAVAMGEPLRAGPLWRACMLISVVLAVGGTCIVFAYGRFASDRFAMLLGASVLSLGAFASVSIMVLASIARLIPSARWIALLALVLWLVMPLVIDSVQTDLIETRDFGAFASISPIGVAYVISNGGEASVPYVSIGSSLVLALAAAVVFRGVFPPTRRAVEARPTTPA